MLYFPKVYERYEPAEVLKYAGYAQMLTFLLHVGQSFIAVESRNPFGCYSKEVLYAVILLIRFMALTSIYATLCIRITRGIKNERSGRVFAIITVFVNLQEQILPLFFNYLIYLFNEGSIHDSIQRDQGQNFSQIVLMVVFLLSFLLVVLIHKLL